MTGFMIALCLIVALLFVYLLVAMLKPEIFP